jgi:glycosyltransferase involved in cell wall biosynthesis
MRPLKILFIGPQWHGSNARGLAYGFRRLGHIVHSVDPDVYFPSGKSFAIKAFQRLTRPLMLKEFNKAILEQDAIFIPDFVLVFKGESVMPETLKILKSRRRYLIQFYPDVSMFVHGGFIPECMPLYDYIFTTKSFGPKDLEEKFGIISAAFIPHGFDPDIHRPYQLSDNSDASFECDASFIGTWSPKKEKFLAKVVEYLPMICFKIWGTQWNKTSYSSLKPYIMGTDILGDMYPLAIQYSKINIALLSEQRYGASSGDMITSRTFHIPASGGFMLHERTDEFLQYFSEKEEADCFSSPEELIEKIRYYLEHDTEREHIRVAGHRRCLAENSLEKRAYKIIEHYHVIQKGIKS